MGYEEGVPLSDRPAMIHAGVEPKDVAGLVSDVFCQMLFTDGFVHCDPHPGNILVKWPKEHYQNQTDEGMYSNGVGIVVLDHALYRRISPMFKKAHEDLWMSAFSGDSEGMLSAARRMLGESSQNSPTFTTTASSSHDQTLKQLVELITNVPWETLVSPKINPSHRAALLEGKEIMKKKAATTHEFAQNNGEHKGKEKTNADGAKMPKMPQSLSYTVAVDERMVDEAGEFANRMRGVLPHQGDPVANADLFFTLKTLACLRASNRAIGVRANVAMSGVRKTIAKERVSRHWLVQSLIRWGVASGSIPVLGSIWRSTASSWKQMVRDFACNIWLMCHMLALETGFRITKGGV
eukprot:CAMPEP_0184495678 /NCGR_PEP_ID=MMETSP0113_2-20130426/32015_1 /TAXON_ID=91329 /ORGANISM="Norrisiella sphaerica, Strain BC52" /LENGTH=350 /DNA_ID=CAMNT_0026881967 /DNA_START=104 /DNA_END=1156 /DNA_ORIENTATION=+